MNSDCISCKYIIKRTNLTVVYENELVFCPLDIDPINKGHLLVIPKRHVCDIDQLHANEISAVFSIIQMMVKVIKEVIKPDGYSIMQNGGKFNDTKHIHFHIIPRMNGDGFGWQYSDPLISKDYFTVYQKLLKNGIAQQVDAPEPGDL